MEIPIIKDTKSDPNPKPDFPLKFRTNSHSQPHSHSPSFLVHNGFASSEFPIADIEMISMEAITYTSLRDLLPSSPPSVMSPTHNSSWYDEIPIKNPLVKHAALAYLQPMSTPAETGNKGFFGRLRDKCSCGHGWFGCFGWLGDVVSRIKEAFWDRRGSVCLADDDDEKEDEKVD
jgi:hypothetical protein